MQCKLLTGQGDVAAGMVLAHRGECRRVGGTHPALQCARTIAKVIQ
ncbi:Uncharacterised protein [Mycobacteroides abscessus subsp. abscessus]|nr:Uncharacterised protein [Mycobacteroides abscessus subsp. abscessus]